MEGIRDAPDRLLPPRATFVAVEEQKRRRHEQQGKI